MLTRLPTTAGSMPLITKMINGKDVSARGAFPYGEKIEFRKDIGIDKSKNERFI